MSRGFLDKILRKDIRLEAKAKKIAGIANSDVRPLEGCLIWLAETLDHEMPLKYMGKINGRMVWVMDVDCNCVGCAMGEDPTLVALRAVIIVHCWIEWCKIPPDERPEFLDKIKEFMAQ